MPKQAHVFRKTKSSRQYARFLALSNMACQIDVVNKQLVSSLSWNNLASEISRGKSYILMIYKHLEFKEKDSLNVEGVYSM